MRLSACALAAALLVAGCGGSSKPQATSTPTGRVRGAAFVQDVGRIRMLLVGSRAGTTVAALYRVVNRNVPAQIRARVPRLVARLNAAYPTVRRRLAQLALTAPRAQPLRQLALYVLDGQVRSFRQLQHDLAAGMKTATAVQRWAVTNETFRADVASRVLAFVGGLPPAQRDPFLAKVKELFQAA